MCSTALSDRSIADFFLQIQELRMGVHFLDKMQQFKMSVPMMAKLQTPSLRERHWNVLIEKTGKNFNMVSTELNLSHLFAMELYKYQVGAFVIRFTVIG